MGFLEARTRCVNVYSFAAYASAPLARSRRTRDTPASLLVDLFKPVPAAFTAATPIVAVNVEFRAIVEGDGAVVDAGELDVRR